MGKKLSAPLSHVGAARTVLPANEGQSALATMGNLHEISTGRVWDTRVSMQHQIQRREGGGEGGGGSREGGGYEPLVLAVFYRCEGT